MTPLLATFLCLAFVGYLFWIDLRKGDGPSQGLWVPLLWMFFAGSRYASSWLGLSPTFVSASDYVEGSPIDRAIFFGLIAAGLVILGRRKADWARVLTDNWWIALYFLFCLASSSWSDDPLVVAKRWIKEIGNVVMVLVILTDPRPYEALGAVLRRLSFLLLPLSVLFIKYYPALARDFKPDGTPMYTGVGHQKNELGLMCLMASVYMLWEFIRRSDKAHPTFVRQHAIISVVFAAMILWLLMMSDSKTPVVCLVAAFFVLVLGRLKFAARNPSRVILIIAILVPLIWFLDEVVDIKATAFSLLGRDPTLTNRTEVWKLVSTFAGNPIVGVGFMSFWTGERMNLIWRAVGPGINQAHNGYLEQFLNLGYIGLIFTIGIMVAALIHISRCMKQDMWVGLLRLSLVAIAALYNITEASFYGLNNMWVLLLLAAIEVKPTPTVRSGAVPAIRQVIGQARIVFRVQQPLLGRERIGAAPKGAPAFRRPQV